MISIQDVRQKYPQYGDMSDEQLADSLHSKYYSDIPKNDFYNKLGLSIKNEESPSISNKAKQALYDMGEANNDAIIGFGDAVNNFPRNVANMISPESMQIPILHQGSGGAYKAGEFGGDLATFLGGGSLLNAIRGGLEGAPLIGKAAKWLGGQSIPQTMARLGLGSAAHGAVMTPEHRELGAILEGVGGGLGGGVGAVAGKLMNPATYIHPGSSLDKLSENVRIAGNTETPLGDVLNSEGLKHFYENLWSKNPFSGAGEKSAQLVKDIQSKGDSILNKYLGNTAPEQVEEKIGNALVKAHEKQQVLKNELYKKAENIADSSLKPSDLTFPTFSKNVSKYDELINDKTFLKYDPELKNILRNVSDYKGNVKLKDANILAGRLNSLAKEHRASSAPEDRNLARIFGELGSSLKGDIKTSIENSGNKSLIDSFKAAEENYKKNFLPFLDKDIYKFTNGGKSAEDILQTFIKTGSATDKGKHLNKLMSALDPESQNLVKYSYLSRSLRGPEEERSVDPNVLKTLLSDTKLGPKQRKALFPDNFERKEMQDYSKLVDMNQRALKRMDNPPTGRQALEAAIIGGHILSGSAGASYGHREGGTPGMIAGGLFGLLGPAAASRYLTNKMTSPLTRQAALEAISKSMSKGSKDIKPNKTGALTSALLKSLISD
jgi:hypothetical protein